MTTRPGGLTIDALRWRRTRRTCRLVLIERVDGFTLRLTDHDRPVYFPVANGGTFVPAKLMGLSADRKEGAFRSGNQEASGFIDGDVITVPDLMGNKYRGARVRIVKTFWDMPLMVISADQKWIRNVVQTGTKFVATLEGVTQRLTRSSAGRLGGSWSPSCTFELGNPDTCRKDIRIGTGFQFAGLTVSSVVFPNTVVDTSVGTTPVVADDFFKDGSFEWLWGAAALDTGQTTAVTAAGSALTGTLTDATKNWAVDSQVNRWVRLLTGAGGTPQAVAWGRVFANSATQLQFRFTHLSRGSNAASYGSGTHYDIRGDSVNSGTVSPVTTYLAASRRFAFLIPTPKPMVTGESGIVATGCDGLDTTCITKFNNILNHGGDPHAPSAQTLVEPPSVTA